jgi:hypothetical protein
MQGETAAAERALSEGETLLRAADDGVELPKLLCSRARIDLTMGRHDAALASLAQAQQHATAFGVGCDSELGREIENLRREVAADARRPRAVADG